jgi:hypothetical protein
MKFRENLERIIGHPLGGVEEERKEEVKPVPMQTPEPAKRVRGWRPPPIPPARPVRPPSNPPRKREPAPLKTVEHLLTEILGVTRGILRAVRIPVTPAVLNMIATLPNGAVVEGNHVNAVINDVQSVPITLTENKPDPTAGGKTVAVPVVGPVVWASSDPAVVSITPATDTLSAVAAAVGPNGTATISAVADGFTGTLDVTVVDSEVGSLTLVPGTPTP